MLASPDGAERVPLISRVDGGMRELRSAKTVATGDRPGRAAPVRSTTATGSEGFHSIWVEAPAPSDHRDAVLRAVRAQPNDRRRRRRSGSRRSVDRAATHAAALPARVAHLDLVARLAVGKTVVDAESRPVVGNAGADAQRVAAFRA